MKALTTHFCLCLLCFTTLPAAETREVADHEYPVKVQSFKTSWRLTGTEHFRYKVLFSVFTAGLYDQVDGDGKRLSFTYTRKIKADDLREQAMKTLATQNKPGTLEKYAALTEKIQKAYEDVTADDNYTITVIKDQGTRLEFNGKEVFFTENSEFGYWYLDIWLGDPPISDSLKEALTQENSK